MNHDSAMRRAPGPSPDFRRLAPLLAIALLAVDCGGAPAARGGPPAMPVEVVTLAMRPVEQTTEFVGTVKSRRSATVQPQVEGFVTRILVRSGARVAPGAALLEIDPRMQEAAVSSLESLLAVRKADLQQARQQADAHEDAARGRGLEPGGDGAGRDGTRHHRGAGQGDRGAAARAARRSRLPHGERPHRRDRGGHSGPGGRPRDEVDPAHHDRRERGPRALHRRARAGSREAAGRPARPPRRRSRQRPRDRAALVRLGLGRGRDAVRAGEGHARERGGTADRADRPRADRLERVAGAHRPDRRAQPRRRPVLRLRGRGRRRRGDRRPPAGRGARARGRQRLRRQVRPEAGREADRVRRAEDRRRRARDRPRRRGGREPDPEGGAGRRRAASPCPPRSSSGGRSSRRSAR